MDRIKSFLQKGVDEARFPGAHYALVTKDNLTTDFVGYKQLYPTKEVLSGDEIYDVASLTKVISTTTLILKLVDDNLLSLDTKLQSILGRYKHPHTTIKELLIHASGLPADVPKIRTVKSKEAVMDIIFSMDLIYEPNTKVVYSDVGFILLGKVIEKMYGMPIDEAAQKYIFDPLGMLDSGYRPEVDRVAPTEDHDDDFSKGLLKGKVHDEKSYLLEGLAGHAGLFSTVYDIGLFIQSILNDRFVLSKDMTDRLFLPQITDDSLGYKVTRTLGYLKPYEDSFAGSKHDFDNTIGHTGFTGCHMFIDKKNYIGFVLLSNAVHPKRSLNRIIGLRNELGNIIYEMKVEKK